MVFWNLRLAEFIAQNNMYVRRMEPIWIKGGTPGVGAAKSTAKKIMGGEELIQGSTGSAHISAGSRSESQPVVRFEAQI